MKKESKNDYDIHHIIRERWSPRAFAKTPVEKQKLQSLFEAARWAASAFNEQPWRFFVGQNGDETYQKILETLVPWNQQWAGKAPVLVLNMAKKTHAHNQKPNLTFAYDLGQAVAFMNLEAVNQGLISHQMSGFSADKAAGLFAIPEDYQAISVTAFGYYGDPDTLPEDMAKSEQEERTRKALNKLVFSTTFEQPSDLF